MRSQKVSQSPELVRLTRPRLIHVRAHMSICVAWTAPHSGLLIPQHRDESSPVIPLRGGSEAQTHEKFHKNLISFATRGVGGEERLENTVAASVGPLATDGGAQGV